MKAFRRFLVERPQLVPALTICQEICRKEALGMLLQICSMAGSTSPRRVSPCEDKCKVVRRRSC